MDVKNFGGVFMNIFKKLFGSKKKKEIKEEKKTECWYNDAHEKGEALRGDTPYGTGGSENIFMAISNSR